MKKILIVLVLSIFSQNIIIIFIAITLFGMLISNVMPIVFRQAVKNSQNPIPVTISHVSSIAFVGAIFGPAVVGISAETFGLTFNIDLSAFNGREYIIPNPHQYEPGLKAVAI